MATLFIYIIKSALCLAAFYLFYKLLLSHDTLHRFNRIALLFILGLSAIMPFVSYNLHLAKGTEGMANISVEQPFGGEIILDTNPEPAPTWAGYLLLVYLAGLLFFVIKNIVSLIRMKRFIDRCEEKILENGTYVYLSDSEVGPFSWMNRIHMSYNDWNNNKAPILSHEKAHIAHRHSLDLIFAQLFVILQWFNPASWLLKREIQSVHEYQADAMVLRDGFSLQSYQELIIEKAIGSKLCTLANNLNNCSTKKRIVMMIKKQTGPWARLKLLYVIPVSLLFVLTFTSTKASSLTSQLLNVSVSNLFSTQVAEDSVFSVVEKMPEFQGGTSGFNQFLRQNIRYPASCREENIQGRVMVEFIIEKDGSISNVAIVKSVEERLDNEAKRVMSIMPNWTPGYNGDVPVRVKYTVPINFQLSNDEPFQVVEKMPEFPGGTAALNEYLKNNIRYPENCKRENIQGRVLVQFVVEADGKITSAQIVKSVNFSLDAEALRVISSMPIWTPGEQHGVAVRVKFTIPVNFKLDNDIISPDGKSPNNDSQSTESSEANKQAPENGQSQPFQVVEQMPEFPGGTIALNDYVNKNLKYPENCKKERIQGRVLVQFVVEADGKISNAEIVKSVNKDLDEEAKRVISSMPYWTPGRQRGEAVRVKFTVPVVFKLD